MEHTSDKKGGIYVHIPFCVQKCPYCDFYSITDLSLKSRYLKALIKEIKMIPAETLVFDTLYLGGGTPSVYGPAEIGQIIETAFAQYKIMPDAEVTLEVNPGTVTFDSLNAYRESGVNRLNLGVQSYQDANLKVLGRIHSAKDATSALEWARRSGFDNIGLDLIYGLPEQTHENWRTDLERAVELNPDHLACYMLTSEPGTPLHQDMQSGRYRPLHDRKVRELFDLTIDYLETHGYVQYEISNFVRRTDESLYPLISRHNVKYWSFAPYVGFGPAAHSFIQPERCWNYAEVERYIDEIEAGRLPVEEKEVLTTGQLLMETIYLGLRTIQGIDLIEFKQRFAVDFLHTFDRIVTDLEKDGLLRIAQNHCALTRKGLAYLDSVVSMFTG
jgi:oxygen-independent coproporphyrinogen-3 oxidase